MNEIESIFKKNEQVAEYGIPYLDKELQGIFKNELILIGARSGAGKTTIANQIAVHNSQYGGVVLFSLENFEGDLLLSEVLKAEKENDPTNNMSLRSFCRGGRYTQDAYTKAREKLSNIKIIYRQPAGFGISEMSKHFIECAKEGARIIIVDHVDYFDMHKPRENENINISEIMREIRGLQDVYNIPVVLISHLRKGTKETIVPTLEDFMGTSNKVKESSTVILFAPDDEVNSSDSIRERPWHKKSTWICIRKDRMDGYHDIACKAMFDLKTYKYDERYILYRINYWGTKAQVLTETEQTDYEMYAYKN